MKALFKKKSKTPIDPPSLDTPITCVVCDEVIDGDTRKNVSKDPLFPVCSCCKEKYNPLELIIEVYQGLQRRKEMQGK